MVKLTSSIAVRSSGRPALNTLRRDLTSSTGGAWAADPPAAVAPSVRVMPSPIRSSGYVDVDGPSGWDRGSRGTTADPPRAVVPGQRPPLDAHERVVERGSDDGEDQDPGPHGGDGENGLGLEDEVSDPLLCGDHLADHHEDDRHLKARPQAGRDLRRRPGQHHLPQGAQRAEPHRPRRVELDLV